MAASSECRVRREGFWKRRAAVFTAYSFLSGMDTLFPPLVALAWAAGLLSFFIAWIVFYSFADVVLALLAARERLKSYHG